MPSTRPENCCSRTISVMRRLSMNRTPFSRALNSMQRVSAAPFQTAPGPASLLPLPLMPGAKWLALLPALPATLSKAVHEEIKLAMGVTGDPVFRRIVRWPAAIPQYVIGHLDRLSRIDALASQHSGLFLTGNAYRGVAMADCVEQAGLVAANVAAYVRSSTAM